MKKTLVTLLILGSFGLIACGGESSDTSEEVSVNKSTDVKFHGPATSTLSVDVDASNISNDQDVTIKLSADGSETVQVFRHPHVQHITFEHKLYVGEKYTVTYEGENITCDAASYSGVVKTENSDLVAGQFVCLAQ